MRRKKFFDENGNFILRSESTKNLDKFSRGFISMIGHESVMSQDELEKQLKLYRAGDMDAKNRIIMGNMRLVIYVAANCYRNLYNLDFNDLIHEGYFGLLKAIDMYEIGDTAFKVYANTCILRHIKVGIYKYESSVKKPEHILVKRRKFKSICDECVNLGKPVPSFEELKEILVVDYDSLCSIIQADCDVIPLKSVNVQDYDSLIVSEDSLLSKYYNENDRQLLIILKEFLDPESYFIICSKFLMKDRVTNVSLGKYFNVTHETIRLKEVDALKKIRPILLIDRMRKHKYEEICNTLGEEINSYNILPIRPEQLHMYHYLHEVVGGGLDDIYYLKFLSSIRYSDQEIMNMLCLNNDVYSELLFLLGRIDSDEVKLSKKYQEYVNGLINSKKFRIYDVVRDDKKEVKNIIKRLNDGIKLYLDIN